MKQMRRILPIILILISSLQLMAQKVREEAPPLKERLFYGGNFGLQFGTITDIQVSPVIGLWVLPRINVAIGPDYRFFNYRGDKTHIYGGKVYTELVVLRNINSVIPIGTNTNIVVHVEDELLSLESAYFRYYAPVPKRFYQNTVLAGGGLSQQVGRRSSINIMGLWVLNEADLYGLYGNPEIRFSFIF
jgi:hypothetical protein